MLPEGTYVRMKVAPNTRMGTVHHHNDEDSSEKLIFRHDPRFADPLPDMYVFEDEVEPCRRPSDVEVTTIHALIKRGS
jgi:hypothetical protein